MSDSTIPSTSEKQSVKDNTDFLSKAVSKSWKTTAIGITLSLTGFVAFSPSHFGGEGALLVQISRYIHMGGLAAFGIVAQDFNVTTQNKNKE